ncbi:hypothetical protein L210DRAFT_843099, partial [Boletus edulis BED1]
VFLWFPDSLMTWRMLTEAERIAYLEHVRDDQGGIANQKFKKDQVMEALLDVRTWLIVLATMLTDIPSGGLTNFSNIIIRNFGYTWRQTLVLATPAGVVEVFSVLLQCGWYSDIKKGKPLFTIERSWDQGERMLPVIWATLPTIVGIEFLADVSHKGTYLIGTFGSTLSVIYAYNASNTSEYTNRNGNRNISAVRCAVVYRRKDDNQKKLKTLAELKAAKGWTDEAAERHAFAGLTDKQ